MTVTIEAADYELAEAAYECSKSATFPFVNAVRMLRDECGWTLMKSKVVLDQVFRMHGWALRWVKTEV